MHDCAHAFGAKYQNEHLCAGIGNNIYTYSFQAIKHLTTVDGGCVIFKDVDLFRRAKKLRWYGIDRENRTDSRIENDIPEWGFKFHMNDLNAAIGLGNFCGISQILAAQKTNAEFYGRELEECGGLQLLKTPLYSESANWLFTILVDGRTDLIKKLAERGIASSPVHKRNDKHSCLWKSRSILPTMDSVEDKILCIPVGWWVTEEDIEYIVATIKKGW